MPRTHDVSDDAAPIFGNSTYTRSPVDATCASARKALALNAITLAGTAVPSPRNPTNAARPSARDAELAGDRADVGGVLAEPEQVLHQHRVRRRRGRQPRHDPRRQHRPAAQHLLDVIGQWRRPLLQPDRARESGRASRIRCRKVDADGEPRPQAQLRAFGDADDVTAGLQRVEDAPLADPLQMLGRTGAAEDGQPTQLVGLLVGRRIGQHVRLVVLDADHPVGAVGDRLSQPEQVGAGGIQRVVTIAVMFERVVDQLVEQLPAGAGFDRNDRGAERDRLLHRGRRRFLDEDGRG